MKFSRIVAISAIAGVIGLGGLQAQTLTNTVLPAEFPPASFTGKQYVDSNGCIFIRAGISGNVTWVPRVGRDRKQVCGYQPSATPAGAAKVPDARTAAQAPEQIQLDPTPSAASVATPAYVKPVAAPMAAPMATVASTTPPVVNTSKTVATTPVATTPRVASIEVPDTTGYIEAELGKGGERVLLSPKTRFVPRHVYENQRLTQGLKVPKGYQAVWDDGRLNPRRGEQTFEGMANSNLIWTNTVPRRLVDATTGQDVTQKIPTISYVSDFTTTRSASISTQDRTPQASPVASNRNTASRSSGASNR
jgi:hypothetical protein